MGTLRVREIAAIVGLLFGWLVLLLLHTWATLAIYFANYHHPFRQNSASDCLCSRLDLARGLYSATHFSSASRFRGLYLGHTLVDVHPTNWAR